MLVEGRTAAMHFLSALQRVRTMHLAWVAMTPSSCWVHGSIHGWQNPRALFIVLAC